MPIPTPEYPPADAGDAPADAAGVPGEESAPGEAFETLAALLGFLSDCLPKLYGHALPCCTSMLHVPVRVKVVLFLQLEGGCQSCRRLCPACFHMLCCGCRSSWQDAVSLLTQFASYIKGIMQLLHSCTICVHPPLCKSVHCGVMSQVENRRQIRRTAGRTPTVSLHQDRIPSRGTWGEIPGSRAVGAKVRAHLL